MISAQDIRQAALSIGLDDCGVIHAQRLDEDAAYMSDWVRKGYNGKMDYLARNEEKRYDPTQLVEGAQTIVIGVLTFEHSGRDYHRKVKSLLYQLRETLGYTQNEQQTIFCDSAPFLERRWAVEAGLGWIGRNHAFIHHTLGSFVHLGEWVLYEQVDGAATIHHPVDVSLGKLCMDCHLCEEHCPSGALRLPEWDVRQCIAYETFKCLKCQLVCPFNQTTNTITI